MTIETTAIVTTCTVAGIVAAIGAVAKHISNDDKHPQKKDIVFRNVCDAEMNGLKDCVEAKLSAVVSDVSEIKKDVKELLKR